MYWRTRHGDRLRGRRTSWPVTASPGAAQAEVPVLSPKTVTTATSAALTAWGPAVRAVPMTHAGKTWPDHPFRCTLGTSRWACLPEGTAHTLSSPSQPGFPGSSGDRWPVQSCRDQGREGLGITWSFSFVGRDAEEVFQTQLCPCCKEGPGPVSRRNSPLPRTGSLGDLLWNPEL